MILRYAVNLEECFRIGVDCASSQQLLEIDPGKLDPEVRELIADRLFSVKYNGQDVMDVCWLEASEADLSMDCKETLSISRKWPNLEDLNDLNHLIVAKQPGFDHLLLAIKKEDSEIADFFKAKGIVYTKRDVF